MATSHGQEKGSKMSSMKTTWSQIGWAESGSPSLLGWLVWTKATLTGSLACVASSTIGKSFGRAAMGFILLTLAATSEAEALARAQNWLAVRSHGDQAVVQTLHALANAGQLKLTPRSWGWTAEEPDHCAFVEVLNFGSALVVGAVAENECEILLINLVRELRRAAIPVLAVARVELSNPDLQPTAVEELRPWLAQPKVERQSTRLALEIPFTPRKPTAAELAVLPLFEAAWEKAVEKKAVADQFDRVVPRRILRRKPGHQLSAAALAAML